MYKLAKDKKASRMFIVNEILDDGFNASAQGKYFLVCGVSKLSTIIAMQCNLKSKCCL